MSEWNGDNGQSAERGAQSGEQRAGKVTRDQWSPVKPLRELQGSCFTGQAGVRRQERSDVRRQNEGMI